MIINFNSIIVRVYIIFSISILLFIAISFSYFKYEQKREFDNIHKSYASISREVHENFMPPHEIVNFVKKNNFSEVENRMMFSRSVKPIGIGPGFGIYRVNNNLYMSIHIPGGPLFFLDNNEYRSDYYGYYIILALLVVFILSFIWIIKAFSPLKNLKKEVQKFSQGNLDINCKSEKKDEISDLANEFDSAAKRISLLLESRQLFLRTIMHELKTPIGKGTIVAELIDDEKQKKRVRNIFNKLELLINYFAKIEEIVSQNYTLNLNSYLLSDIVHNSIDMLMLDNFHEKITLKELNNVRVIADMELMSIAIKNLLDNAIKYSSDHKVEVSYKNSTLQIISNGQKLPNPIEEYYKAFHNDTKLKNHGMGLGLYIVHSIVSIHKMKLEYSYDNKNIFSLIFSNHTAPMKKQSKSLVI